VAVGATALPHLLAALQDPDFRVRRRACRLLLRLGDERAIPPLSELARDPDPTTDVRAAAAWAAYRLGHGPALEIVKAELTSSWWHRRLNAVTDLAALEDAGAAPFLAMALEDPTWLTRLRALSALRALDPRPHAARLVVLVSDEIWVIRRDALRTLLALGEVAEVEPAQIDGVLAGALFDEEVEIRRMASRAVADRNSARRSLDLSIRFSLQNDLDPQVRAELLRALGADSDVGSAEIRGWVRDPSWLVRAEVAIALAQRGEKGLGPRLVGSLEPLGAEELESGAAALVRLGDSEVVPALTRLARSGSRSESTARDLLAALGRPPSPWRDTVRGQIHAWLRERPEARRLGIDLLARLGDPALAADLPLLLGDPSSGVRQSAARALSALGGALSAATRAAVAPLLAHREGEDPAARDVARQALSALAALGLPPEVLRALCEARSAWVRALALRSLAFLGEGADAALRALGDQDGAVRTQAAATLAAALPVPRSEAIASRGAAPGPAVTDPWGPAALAALGARLEDPEASVRAAVARALWTLGDPRGRAELRASLRGVLATPDPARRLAVRDLRALAAQGDPEAAALLLPSLLDDDAPTRWAAQEAVTSLMSQAALSAASSGKGPLRYATAMVLARRGARTGLAEAMRPLASVGVAEIEREGEYQPERLARRLGERLPKSERGADLDRYLRRSLVPDLLAALATSLSREVVTRWRGMPAYSLRRQNLFDQEIASAVRAYPGLHPKVVKALLFQESNLEPWAGNRYDCVGIAAFCRGAGAAEGLRVSARTHDFEGDARYHPPLAIAAAVRHLRRKATLLEEGPFARFGAPRGDDYWAFVLAAYNGGHAQVADAMERSHERGLALARERGLRGPKAAAFARSHAVRWDNTLVPDEEIKESPLYKMTQKRYGWYRPYGRYRKMKGAEAKYHEIGQFPLEVLDRAFQGEARPPSGAGK
jgi:HEAT repeat protein